MQFFLKKEDPCTWKHTTRWYRKQKENFSLQQGIEPWSPALEDLLQIDKRLYLLAIFNHRRVYSQIMTTRPLKRDDCVFCSARAVLHVYITLLKSCWFRVGDLSGTPDPPMDQVFLVQLTGEEMWTWLSTCRGRLAESNKTMNTPQQHQRIIPASPRLSESLGPSS